MTTARNLVLVLSLTLVSLVQSKAATGTTNTAMKLSQYDFSVIIDAGSSGCRVWIYKWPKIISNNAMLPDIKAVNSYLFEAPLSKFSEDLHALKLFLITLIDSAKKDVPTALQNNTEIFLFATAGMRLLMDSNANEVFEVINDFLSDPAISPFRFDSAFGAKILSGEEEGLFSWFTVNYLRGTFNTDNRTPSSVGLLELGGASTQIAFVPKGNPLAGKTPVRFKGQRYPLYAHSYLHYGLNYVEIWIREKLKQKFNNHSYIPNPCLLNGDIFKHVSTPYTFIGTGNPTECMDLLHNLVYKVEANRCHPKPCAIGTIYQPAIPTDMKFYAIGGFVPSLRDLKAVDSQGNFVLRDVLAKSNKFCQTSFAELLTEMPQLKKYLSKTCLAGLYTVLLLNKGYGFSMDSTNLIAAKDVNGQKISWTMGAVLYELVIQSKRR